MAKNKAKADFCPLCGKAEIPRDPWGKINYDAGGWNERCPACRSLLWVPADRTEPIEVVVIPVFGFPSFEPEEINLFKAQGG